MKRNTDSLLLGKYRISKTIAQDKNNAEFIAYANEHEFSIRRISKGVIGGGNPHTYI